MRLKKRVNSGYSQTVDTYKEGAFRKTGEVISTSKQGRYNDEGYGI
jgi:hypothetical protein